MSNNFTELFCVDISNHTEKKGKYTYLSWAWAWKFIKERDNESKCVVTQFGEHNYPYLQTPIGFFVEVSITYKGISETERLPVLDNSNNVIDNPDAFDINRSIKRCKAKAIALHGLGLGLWINEDISDLEKKSTEKKTEYKKADKPKDNAQDVTKSKNAIHDLLKNHTAEQKKDLLKKATFWKERPDYYCDDINNLTIKGRDPSVAQMRIWYKKLQEQLLNMAEKPGSDVNQVGQILQEVMP